MAATSFGSGRKNGLPRSGPVPFTVIMSGTHSVGENYEVKLITGHDEWVEVWKIAGGTVEPMPQVPSIDFNHYSVIAAFMGTRNSSGYKIEIRAIEREGAKLKVRVKKFETPGMLPVVTHPFTLVKVPKGKYELEVIEESVQ
jgi:hypothetical protein